MFARSDIGLGPQFGRPIKTRGRRFFKLPIAHVLGPVKPATREVAGLSSCGRFAC